MGPVRKFTASVLLGAVVSVASPAALLAQTSESERKDSPEKVPELPVSLDRIRRELAQQVRTTESRDGLRLSYYVDVYGTAPRLELFTPGQNIANSPVMYGGMTHQEFLRVVTPEEFRSPAADIPGAIAALVKWAVEKRKKPSNGDK